ncbi:hypothetical protein ACH42_06175 [Endozoicomonas sp. (ex Bugula neritina AB1)]|nr:hypothetical protein ACH42_06175 [Endozoicomonas sp. (ex Bugula neritina AB1)]
MKTKKNQQNPHPLQVHLTNACHSFKHLELQLRDISAKGEQISETMRAIRKNLEANTSRTS